MYSWFFPLVVVLANVFTTSEAGSSLTFVIDDTLSMGDEINAVKQSVNAIMDVIFDSKSSLVENLVLVTFNDPVVKLVVNQSTDRNEIVNALHYVVPHNHNNRDWAEMSMEGVLEALDKSNPGSFLYVFTDADPKHPLKKTEVIQLCQRKRSQIVFVITELYNYVSSPSYNYKVYYEIAAACSGTIFVIPDKNIKPVIDDISNDVQDNQTVITTVTGDPYKMNRIPFDVDDQTDAVIIKANGKSVQLSVNAPSNVQIRTLWTEHNKAIKLTHPTPGTYIVETSANSAVSIKVIGKTEFFFNHGFSQLQPNHLSETSPQPIADTSTRLSVAISDPKKAVRIEHAQILTEDKRLLNDLELTKMSEDFYSTKPFVAQSQPFLIAVVGTVISTGDTIVRFADRPIIPQIPPKPDSMKPSISIAEGTSTKIEYKGSARLTCKVSGYPAPEINWYNKKRQLQHSTSSVVQEPYEYISYMSIANVVSDETYTCEARNSEGRDSKTIQVIAKSPFKVGNTVRGTTNVAYASEAFLKCEITSHLPQKINWYFTRKSTSNLRLITPSNIHWISNDGKQLKINKVDLNMEGKYTCVASLIGDENVHIDFSTDVNITGLAVPVFKADNSKTVIKHTDITMTCLVVKGSPKPQVLWYFMGKQVGTGEVYRISKVEDNHAGAYKCVAENVVGKAEHVTQLNVHSKPQIMETVTKYEGVVGDVALRIPCNADGIPKPAVTWSWKLDDKTGVNDNLFQTQGNTLVLKKLIKNYSGKYTCKATNYLGSNEHTAVVTVSDMPATDGQVHDIHLLEGQDKIIECGSDYDPAKHSVHWFLDVPKLGEGIFGYTLNGDNPRCKKTVNPGTATTTPKSELLETTDRTRIKHHERPSTDCLVKVDWQVINITNASEDHNGFYTCRVSGENGGRTEIYRVIVGSPPKFLRRVVEDMEWDGEDSMILDCMADGKPLPEAQWTLDGKVLPGKKSMLLDASSQWGHYTCNVSNVHGHVSRNFDVSSSGCIIDTRNHNNKNEALILSIERSWPTFPISRGFMTINHDNKLVFSCPQGRTFLTGFLKFPTQNELVAVCDKQDIYIINGKSYKLSELKCSNDLEPTVVRTGTKCSTEDSELIRVGFNVDGQSTFLETYEVCYDRSNNLPIYSRAKIFRRRGSFSHDWYKYPGISDGVTHGYTCRDSDSKCCYGRTQLVNGKDFQHSAAQKSAFIESLNEVPSWRPCSQTTDWEVIDESISLESNEYFNTIVWSGTHMLQNINGNKIPRYLWKVMRFDDMEPKVRIYVNSPTPTKADVLCNNTCNFANSENPSEYCCNFDDFLKAFKLEGSSVAESINKALDETASKK